MTPNIQLLQDLRNALVELEAKDWKTLGFNMEYWANRRPKTPDLGCGTECCAFGLGTSLPSWKAAGLKLIKMDIIGIWTPCENARETLGLTESQWHSIFINRASRYTSPQEIADLISDVITGGADPSPQLQLPKSPLLGCGVECCAHYKPVANADAIVLPDFIRQG